MNKKDAIYTLQTVILWTLIVVLIYVLICVALGPVPLYDALPTSAYVC